MEAKKDDINRGRTQIDADKKVFAASRKRKLKSDPREISAKKISQGKQDQQDCQDIFFVFYFFGNKK
jgi:hypothetical protein